LHAYLPFVEPLSEFYPGQSIVDLGCGRGEWLELMEASGFKAHGVDLDEGMLRSCRQLGLAVEHTDAIAFISSLGDESQVIVSAFHFVEHISFADLRTLVAEAFRVLVPGGLLIMETPNPENLIVATQNFYLDPTHERPIPPQLLSFIPEYYGFKRIKIVRLQEPLLLPGDQTFGIQGVLTGVSPDYGVIAQKLAAKNIWSKTERVFKRKFGVELEELTRRFDSQILYGADRAQQADLKAEQAGTQAQQADLKAEQALHALEIIYESRSWRWTASLRWMESRVPLLQKSGVVLRIKVLEERLKKILSLHR